MSDKLAKFDFFQSSPIEHNNFDNPLEKTAEESLILSIFRHGKYDFLIYFICILENSNDSIFRHLQGSPNHCTSAKSSIFWFGQVRASLSTSVSYALAGGDNLPRGNFGRTAAFDISIVLKIE